MKGKRRIISICLALCLLISMLPMQVLAAEEAASVKEVLRFAELRYASKEEKADEEFYEDPSGVLFYRSEAALQRIPAGDMLSGDEKVLYDALVPYMRQIANGERASAVITVGQTAIDEEGYIYEVDTEAVFTSADFTMDMLSRVVEALLSDLPYDCYWYDKGTGCVVSCLYGLTTVLQVSMLFTVASNYRGEDEFTVDTAKTGAAKAAAAKAQAIVDKYAGASDYEKLLGYKNEICALVSYDYAAAEGFYFDIDIDPWQLISVFDGNNSTNVVCEGYAKAFMYLCEMTEFTGEVSCYTVMGGVSGIPHMWNIVDIDGKSYLADLTNSDTGTVGEDGCLFLAGGEGSVAAGFNVAGLYYSYDKATQSLWGTELTSLLTLEPVAYDPSWLSSVKWSFENGVLTISGSGDMWDFSQQNNQLWSVYRYRITSVVIEEGISSIGDHAFDGCMSLVNVTIPDSVKAVGDYAFRSCSSLTGITLPAKVKTIGNFAFYECSGIADISIPDGVSYIGYNAFQKCSSLRSIAIPEGVTSVGGFAFYGCSKLTDVELPDSLTEIGNYAFYYCVNLESIIIPEGVSAIGDDAFGGCSKLAGAHYFGAAGDVRIGSNNAPLTNILHYCTKIPGTATCETAGTLDAWFCDTCDTAIVEVVNVSSKGHTEVIDKGVEATCTAAGKSEGKHCSVCEKVIVEQQTVPAKGHSYEHEYDPVCDRCGEERVVDLTRPMVNMFRMYDPYSGEHFYTGSEEERDMLVAAGWHYEGIGFTFPLTTGKPVYRLYEPISGEHLYTMDEEEKATLLAQGWNDEGIAFNSGFDFEVPQYRLHNPYATRGAYHFTASTVERDDLIAAGWEYQGIGWYSCGK